jgi:hypothetical protein
MLTVDYDWIFQAIDLKDYAAISRQYKNASSEIKLESFLIKVANSSGLKH